MNPDFGEYVALFHTAHAVLLVNHYLTVKMEVRERVVIPIIVLSIPISYSLFYAGFIILLTNSDLVFDKIESLLWWIISGISWKLLETGYGAIITDK